MAAGTDQTYRYARPSTVSVQDGATEVSLATSGGFTTRGPAEHPVFFDGFLGHPEQSAALRRSRPLAHAGTELHVGEYESRFEQALAFCALQLPHHPDELASLVHLVQLRDLGKNRGVTAVLLDAWARSDRRIGPPAASSLVLGLAARDARVRASAQDAMLDLAASGLLDGSELGRQAAAHLADERVVGTRVAGGLAEVARADDAAVLAVMDALATLLPSLPGRRDAAAFLEPAAELAERTGRRLELPQEFRVQAAGTSTSIAAKAARRLVAVSDAV